MAKSPAHKFGQMIGNLLENILVPTLQQFCDDRKLYLDKKGIRGKARKGNKVTWQDKYGNFHDLDFVIEKDGTNEKIGRPLVFLEVAWRRYTKHSRNKAQEIQGAVLPIAERYYWDAPFKGVVLGGVFTDGSLQQMKSRNFHILYFPYETVINAFSGVGIDAGYDENTTDAEFEIIISKYEGLTEIQKNKIKSDLYDLNRAKIETFMDALRGNLDRSIDKIIIIPLYGKEYTFVSLEEAERFLKDFGIQESENYFRKYELIIGFNNGDKIEGTFSTQEKALEFLKHVAS